MKYYLHISILIFLFLGVHSTFAQGVALNRFNIIQDGSGIKLDWEVQDVTGVTEFRVYRKMDAQSDYAYLATIPSNGGTSYNYIDHDVFKTTSSTIVTYQLRIIKYGVAYPFDRTFTHSTTAIRQTWGSIKSMFR